MFILYQFAIIYVDIFFYKFGQTLASLTSDKSNMQSKKKWRDTFKFRQTNDILFGTKVVSIFLPIDYCKTERLNDS